MSLFDRLKNDIYGDPSELEPSDLNEAISESDDLVSLCNNINRKLITQEIQSLDLTEDQTEQLEETIYLNCADSGYNKDLADQFLEENKLNEENN